MTINNKGLALIYLRQKALNNVKMVAYEDYLSHKPHFKYETGIVFASVFIEGL